MNPLKLLVVIVNYKTPNLVIDALASLKPELYTSNIKIVVVDNDSQDGSSEAINEWIQENDQDGLFKLIDSGDNVGFSGGNNVGIRSEEADYYLLLNSDTIVRPGVLKTLLESAEKHPKAGLISPRLEWPDSTPQESCFNFHRPISEFVSSAGTGSITKFLSRYIIAQPIQNSEQFYQWTSFACVMIKKDVFKDIGLMDAGYFMYYEDVAFSRKAQLAGWKVLNVPQARVVHLRGGSSPLKKRAKLRKRLPRYFFESRTRYYFQFYGRSGLLLANLLWMIGWAIGKSRTFISKNYVPNFSKLQWLDIWTNFFTPKKAYLHPREYKK